MNDLIYIAVIGLFFYLLLNNKDQSKNNLTLLVVILGFIFTIYLRMVLILIN